MQGQIFRGLRVIDCGSFIAGPASATIMSDFGADVIKVEPPKGGDPQRNLYKHPELPRSETNYGWMLDSRNKRSLALDLRNPEGAAVLKRLVATADVFITNFPAHVRAKLGITKDDLTLLNDRLIYASMTAYGESGPEADKPGFDSTAWWARSGLMDIVRPDAESPVARLSPAAGDHVTSICLLPLQRNRHSSLSEGADW